MTGSARRWPRPRLATVLVLMTLVILALPLGGIAVLRIYESALVRQTESELIAQGAFVASAYRAQLADAKLPPAYGNLVTTPPRPVEEGNRWRPYYAALDLADDPVLPAPPPSERASPADPVAATVGRELEQIVRDAQQVTLAGVRVTDAAGVVVVSTGEDIGESVRNLEEVQLALSGEYASRMRWRGSDQPPPPPLESISRGTRIRVFVAVPIVLRERVVGCVLLARTPANIRQALYGKRRELALAGIVLLAVVVGLALFASLTIARPVRALRDQARRAARGEQGAVVPLANPGTREIAELSETVAEMAQTLESRARYIRDFAAHVSHEFKTPLTAMQGAAEMLREHDATMSAEERERFLGIIERDTRRLSQLVRRLLELARADVLAAPREAADVGAVLAALAQRHPEVPVSPAPQAQGLRAAIGAETLEDVLSNLIDNVRVHAGPSAAVTLEATAVNDEVQINVADNGLGISVANAARIFEPFFTTARERGGTGLGLPIARALLRACGGDLALGPSERGARFVLRLPRA